MSVLLQIIAVVLNLILFFNIFQKVKYNLRIVYITVLIFQTIFVVPVVLEWIFGIQDYSYKSPGFDKALNDITTNMIYSLFIIIIPLTLYLFGKRNKSRGIVMGDIRTTILNIRINRELYVISVILMFLPLLLALLAPSPDKYLTEYAYFQKFSTLVTDTEWWYHSNIMRIGGFASLVFISMTKLFSKNTIFMNCIVYFAAIITGILNGKRTLLTFIIFAILAVDILKSPKGKFPMKTIIISGLFILTFFVGYAFLIDKHTASVSTLDNLRLYFFRDTDVKFSIYALLNPDQYRVLDYLGQSYLYNILFYIPRNFWPNKPYPYDTYVTAAALGYPPGTILNWNFQTSIFGAALSNFGWLGIPFIITLISKFIKVSERSQNPIINVLCIFIVMFSFMNHFGAWRNYFIIWLVLYFFHNIKFKIFSRKTTKKPINQEVEIL